jgi:hypothetical protein
MVLRKKKGHRQRPDVIHCQKERIPSDNGTNEDIPSIGKVNFCARLIGEVRDSMREKWGMVPHQFDQSLDFDFDLTFSGTGTVSNSKKKLNAS